MEDGCVGASARIGGGGWVSAMELRLSHVPGRTRRLAALPPAHPVVGGGERRLPEVVFAQRVAGRSCPDRGLPSLVPEGGQGVSARGRAAHRRRARPHPWPAAFAGGR